MPRLLWIEGDFLLRKMKTYEFKRVYDILEEAFNSDERRSFDGQARLFEDSDYDVLVDEETKGLLAVWNFEDMRYVEHFAVEEKFRNNKLGGRFLDEYLRMDNSSVVLEVELPGEELTDRRINFYKRHGFCFNEYDYVQPPMEEGKNPVPLRIMSYPDRISEEQFMRLRDTLYKKVYKVRK